MTQLRFPHLTGDTAEQLRQLKHYLVYLVQELNYALEQLQKEKEHGNEREN